MDCYEHSLDRSAPVPVAGGIVDNDEEFEITWTAVFFDLSIEAASS